MNNKTVLDSYEQDIEDNFEDLQSITNLEKEKAMLKEAAQGHVKRKKSITIRVSEVDLEALLIIRSAVRARPGEPYTVRVIWQFL
jgi:predicted DNA binding CopG/RHH family protein